MNRIERFTTGNTTNDLESYLRLLNNGDTIFILLCATDDKLPLDNALQECGVIACNLPALNALIKMQSPSKGEYCIIFDGDFLTASRLERAKEIESLLKESLKKEFVFFTKKRAPITSHLSPEEAYDIFSGLGQGNGERVCLTKGTEKDFRKLFPSLSM